MGLSVTLNIASRALLAQQYGVNVTAHNIANANTRGFSRQRVELQQQAQSAAGTFGQNGRGQPPGLGVDAVAVQRIRDVFLDFQVRESYHAFGRHDAEAQVLEQAEVLFHEPSESGLGSLFADFWNTWRDLSNEPETLATREAVIAQAQALTQTIRGTHDQLRALQRSVDTEVDVIVREINSLATDIASLNVQIMRIEGGGAQAPDLRDRRDSQIDAMAQLVDLQVAEQTNGSVTVNVGGRSIVFGSNTTVLKANPDGSNFSYKEIIWEDTAAKAAIGGGELRGLLEARDVSLVQTIDDLNTLAAQVITQVNTQHAVGYGLDNSTGNAFFTGSDAADINLNAVVAGDANKVAAASATGLPGDASNALAIADLEQALTMNGGLNSFSDFYFGAVGRLGIRIEEARNQADNQAFLRDHVETLRDSVSGVSLDEEMGELIKFQRAFEAAARLVSAADEMLDTLINRMGAGR